MTNPARKRIYNDSAEGVKITEGDPIAHSPEALKVLTEKGPEAWRQFVNKQKATKGH